MYAYKGSRSLLQLALFMTDLVDGATDLLVDKRGGNGGSKTGGSRLEERPEAAASFSFKWRLDLDGSNWTIKKRNDA